MNDTLYCTCDDIHMLEQWSGNSIDMVDGEDYGLIARCDTCSEKTGCCVWHPVNEEYS